MLAWLLAVAGGVLLAAGQYLLRGRVVGPVAVGAAVLRAAALALLLALLLDAPSGRARPRPPLVALDASASWLRGGDSAAWQDAQQRARSERADSLILFGDSARAIARRAPATAADAASSVRGAVERASGAGRALVVVTDGELADAEALRTLPGGSRVVVVPRAARRDGAVVTLEAPHAAVSGDTLEARVTVRAGATATPGGTVMLALDGRPVGSARVGPLAPFAETALPVRFVPVASGASLLQAVLRVDGDAEPRNDTLAVALELSRAAGAVFVSTAPDFDARFALAVLRGALAVPTRGYFRVAPGNWRVDGSLAAVGESEVRRAFAAAPLAVLHGDTAAFGPPRAATIGALALLAPPAVDDGEYFATSAPVSPLSPALGGLPWDSLPPLAVSPVLRGEWTVLETRRARTQEARAAVVGVEQPRRIVTVGAAGLWRWRFRGGAAADAYDALWGSVFDWLLAGRRDVRAALPVEGVLRAGEPVRWRRGAGDDSLVRVSLARRTTRRDAAPADSILLRFPPGAATVETPPLPPGIYDVRVAGGAALLAVNPSRELLPVAPSVRSGAVGGGSVRDAPPSLRTRGWPFVLLVLLFCGEWLLRRRGGMR